MSKHPRLPDLSVLVVDDEIALAKAYATMLRREGAIVVGPASTLQEAAAMVASTSLHVAVLDIHLGDDLVFPVADALLDRGVPFVFVTGYDGAIIPDRFGHATHLSKPVNIDHLVHVLQSLIERRSWA